MVGDGARGEETGAQMTKTCFNDIYLQIILCSELLSYIVIMQLEWKTLFIRQLSVMEFTTMSMSVSCISARTQSTFSMVLMESYLFCASVRLGVIIISVFALFKSIIIIYIVSTGGLTFIETLIRRYDINNSYRASYFMVRDTIHWLEKYPETVEIILQLYSIAHILSCGLAAYGAYKLKKNFAIPLAFFEFIYIIQVVTILTLFLRILRHFISIIYLTLLSIAATFYSMLVVYDFFVLLAFEQIVRLVMSKRYQQIYGTDPFNPILTTPYRGLHNPGKHISELPIIVHVEPVKWWHVKNSEKTFLKEEFRVDEMHKCFQSHELLPKVILRNVMNIDYTTRHRF